MYPPPAPSSSPCRKGCSKHNQLLLLINEVLSTLALVQLPFSYKATSALLCAADCTRKARFTVLLEGLLTGYTKHLRSHSLNLPEVPECTQAVLFSLQNNWFELCLLRPLLEAYSVVSSSTAILENTRVFHGHERNTQTKADPTSLPVNEHIKTI